MALFIERYLQDPGNEVLLEIEQVAVLDLDPPATISGIGTGTVLIAGEFENGPYETVQEATSANDLVNTWGELGYRYGGVPGNYPCAVSRNADSAIEPEYWNGNGFVQLSGKKFRRLLVVRVDTSVGEVTMYREAFITGAAAFSYNLEPAQTLVITKGGSALTATFSATAAQYTSGTGTAYPTGFVGGETVTLGYDQAPDVVVTFTAADQTEAQVVARINAAFGFTFADTPAPATLRFTGRQRGNAAEVRVVAGSAGVFTALNLAASTTLGTGNVGNIDAVKFAEVKTILEAAFSGTTVEQDASGKLRLSVDYVASGDYLTVLPATTATNLGFTVGSHNSNTGKAILTTGAGVYPTLFAGGETLSLAYDDSTQITVTFAAGDQTRADVIAKINAAMGYAFASADTVATKMIFTGKKNGGSVRVITSSSGAVFTALGLTAGTTTATPVSAGKIPAGTLLSNAASTQLCVTTQDVAVTVASVGPYTARVRHAIDDGTGTTIAAGTLTEVVNPISLGSFDVENLALIGAALTEGQLDAQYAAAIDKTKNANNASRIVNVIFSARQSNAVRRALRANALDASAHGLFGRMACIRPPLNTAPETALSNIAEPGVGAYRDQRVIYCYPGASTFVPLIARRGTSGGAGFTADGIVDVGFDGFVASILSQLAPEENPGQTTTFTTGIIGLESGSNVQDFEIGDYKNFRAGGIAALRMDDGVATIQSGVTSVDPSVYPQLRNIARRRMADFIQDTLARRCKAFGKKLNLQARRKAMTQEIKSFLDGLLSKNDPTKQRIAGYTLDDVKGNTPATLALGIFREIVAVRTLSSLDVIVLESTVGESVEVNEVLPQAA